MPCEIIYARGCCLNNGKDGARGGVGVYFGDDRNISIALKGDIQTNGRADLTAAIEAVKNGTDEFNLIIKTKSKYVVEAMNKYILTWEEKGWRKYNGRPLKNVDLLKDLYNCTRAHCGIIRFEHVSKKSKSNGIKKAYKLAKNGAEAQ